MVTPVFRLTLCNVGVEPDAPEIPKLKSMSWPVARQPKVFAVAQVEDVANPWKVVLDVDASVKLWPVDMSVTTT